jgi:hypothetical protein
VQKTVFHELLHDHGGAPHTEYIQHVRRDNNIID